MALLHTELSRHIELPGSIRKRDSDAEACIGTIVRVLANPKENHFVPARAFWTQAGVAESDMDPILTPDSEMKYQLDLSLIENLLESAPIPTFKTEIDRMIEPLYAPVQASLDEQAHSKYGFNNHEYTTHIKDVAANVESLMKLAKAGDRETKLALLAAKLHDMGNAYGRTIHGPVLDYLLAAITKSERFRETEIAVSVLAAITHDESMATPLLDEALKKSITSHGELDYQYFQQLYAKLHTRIASALRISDKVVAAHPNRLLNTRELDAAALSTDNHFLMSSLFAFRSMERVNNAFRVNIAFSLTPEELLAKIPALGKERSHHKGRKVALPEDMKLRLVKDDPMTHYFHQAHEMYWSIYYSRMQLMVVDAFNLFPEIDEVQIVFNDSELFSGIPTSKIHEVRHTFHKADFMNDLTTVKNQVQRLK